MITETKKIQKLLKNLDEFEKNAILASAWSACCDGEFLAQYDLKECPWNSGNEEKVEEIEFDAVQQAIKNLE